MKTANVTVRLLWICVLGVVLRHFRCAQGHGHMVDPPARSSMWREGFKTPRNYNDNQLNCGGYYNQWGVHNGKCGICGDPYQNPQPRDNESGGKYGQGIVTRTYQAGQEVTMKILITANHMGWFEFRLCPDGSPTRPVNQTCLDRYVLQMADGSGTRFDLAARYNTVRVKVKLPDGVTCKQCVIQWRWHAGNSFGQDTQGNWCKGCGPQEEFYGCADVAIASSSGIGQTARPVTSAPQSPVTYTPRPSFTLRPQPPVTTYTPRPSFTLRPQPPVTTYTPRPSFTLRPPATTAPQPQQSTQVPYFTFPPVTSRPQTSGPVYPQTPRPTLRPGGVVYPTFRPVSVYPYFTTAPTAAPAVTTRPTIAPAPAQTYRPPIGTQSPIGNRPTGFVPISIRPTTKSPSGVTPFNPFTQAPPQTPYPFFRPQTTPYRPVFTTRTPTNRPVFTFAPPPQTTPRPQGIITTPNRPAQPTNNFFRPPTTKRPQQPALTFTFRPQQTTPRPQPLRTRPTQPVTYQPIVFTLFPRTTPTTATTPTTPRRQTPRPTTARPIILTYSPQRTPLPTRPPATTTTTTPAPAQPVQRCFGINSWTGVAELDAYCNAQCQMVGGQCPAAFCACA